MNCGYHGGKEEARAHDVATRLDLTHAITPKTFTIHIEHAQRKACGSPKPNAQHAEAKH